MGSEPGREQRPQRGVRRDEQRASGRRTQVVNRLVQRRPGRGNHGRLTAIRIGQHTDVQPRDDGRRVAQRVGKIARGQLLARFGIRTRTEHDLFQCPRRINGHGAARASNLRIDEDDVVIRVAGKARHASLAPA